MKRVADWCDVGDDAVYQWLSRGSNEEPIPVRRVSAIINGARRDGIDFDARILWPSMPGQHVPREPGSPAEAAS